MQQVKLIECWVFIKKNFFFKKKRYNITTLYQLSKTPSGTVHSVQFWSPHRANDKAKLEAVQRRAMKMISSLRNKPYKERLTQRNLLSLEKRLLRGKIIECFKIFKGFTNLDTRKLFSFDNSSHIRSNCVKLRCKQVQLDCTKFFITNDVVKEWNKLPSSAVQCDTIISFKSKLDHHLLQQGLR